MAKDEDGNNKAADHQGDDTQAEEDETRHEWVMIYDTHLEERDTRERDGGTLYVKQTKDYIATTRT